MKTARSARVHKRDRNGDIMLTEKRQEEIVRLVYERESITVAELKEILHSSESTIRRDIIALDQEGRLTLFGGADFFLNYNYMPIHMEPQHEMHAMGIFLIEIGVAICVMMTIINLLDAIVKRGDEDGSAQ
mgnify:CR=1 FL=1